MIGISEEEWRRAFPTWLRTGSLPSSPGEEEVERKFNPWHDPENGRFTFAGTGRFFRGGGGSFGGGGSAGGWENSHPKRPSANQRRPSATTIVPGPQASGRSAGAPALSEKFRTVVRNGYSYEIDTWSRTRRVSGILTMADVPSRSRTSQRQAGGTDRRTSDDGGHYIAARFNGPTEAFNHFAQDANFNRGGYRVLEDEWAREKRAGRAVMVKIVPVFDGNSRRPSAINVWWTVDGVSKSQRLSNERSERRRVPK